MVNPAFTVLICTRDRVDTLRKTVELVLQHLSGFSEAKLVIVDNGSTDGTGDYLRKASADNDRILAVYEPTPGLYHARVSGFAHASGRFLLLLDDDMVPGQDWPRALIDELAQHPELGAVGTAIYPVWEDEPPRWMNDLFLRNILYSLPGTRTTYGFPYYPSGGSLAIRLMDFLQLYSAPQRTRLQLGWGAEFAAEDSVGGDDWDLSELYVRNGFAIKVLGGVRVGHRAVAARLSPSWVLRKFENDGRLRIRYARLAGYPLLSIRVLLLLTLFPVLSLCGKLARMMHLHGPRSLTVQAYACKARGVWRELIWGVRGIRFPYHLNESSASTPALANSISADHPTW